jgi:DMSO/TMAO reductase YedYZ molybdopterin-dependent catalytic subunit
MFSRRGLFTSFVLAALLVAFPRELSAQGAPKLVPGAQDAPPAVSPVLIQVAGEVARPLGLSADDLVKLPRQTVQAKAHNGVESRFEGVSLIEVLTKAGVPTGKDLRGPAMALYVVVEAADGYRAAFALAELDPAFTDRVILLADHRDGKPLSAREGPLQIIVPGEKKHARWVKQVIRLKVGRG